MVLIVGLTYLEIRIRGDKNCLDLLECGLGTLFAFYLAAALVIFYAVPATLVAVVCRLRSGLDGRRFQAAALALLWVLAIVNRLSWDLL